VAPPLAERVHRGDWAGHIEGRPIASGHRIQEEAPEETTRRLVEFLT